MSVTLESIAKRVKTINLVGIVLTVGVAVFISIGRAEVYSESKDVIANGVHVDAEIKEAKHWQETGKKGRVYDRYAVVYEFSDKSGNKVVNEVRVKEDDFPSFKEGSLIPVLYPASSVADNRLKTQWEYGASITNIIKDVLIASGIGLAMTFGVAFLVSRKLRKQLA